MSESIQVNEMGIDEIVNALKIMKLGKTSGYDWVSAFSPYMPLLSLTLR